MRLLLTIVVLCHYLLYLVYFGLQLLFNELNFSILPLQFPLILLIPLLFLSNLLRSDLLHLLMHPINLFILRSYQTLQPLHFLLPLHYLLFELVYQ